MKSVIGLKPLCPLMRSENLTSQFDSGLSTIT